jgi:hypothetical protein
MVTVGTIAVDCMVTVGTIAVDCVVTVGTIAVDCVVTVGTIAGFNTRTKHGKNGHTCGECHKTRARREHLLMTQGAGPMPAWKNARYAVVAASAT